MRKVEELAQEDKAEGKKPKEKSANPYSPLAKELSKNSGLDIKIKNGKVIIAFANDDELQQIIARIG